MSILEKRTDKFQTVGSTVFLLEETGRHVPGPAGTVEPELRNKVMFSIYGSSTFDQAQCEWLAEGVAHMLNARINDKQDHFRQTVICDVEEDEDDN